MWRVALSLLWLLLAAGSVSAASPALRQQMMQPPGWVFWGLPQGGLDYDFKNGRYWVKGTGYEPPLLTTVRASQETCTDAYGILWYFANNQPCLTQNAAVWEARTNDALWSNDLTQAGTWTKTNTTAALNATGPDNIANSASTITASAGNGTILQAITLASQADTYSVYVRCVTCTGTISIAEYPAGTPAFTALTSSNCFNQAGTGTAPNTSSWVRCSAEATILNPVIGLQIANSSDSIQVFCNQLEPGTFMSPCIPTTSGAVARAADAITLTNPPVFGAAYSLVVWGMPAAPSVYTNNQFLSEIGSNDGGTANRFGLLRAAFTGAAGMTNTVASVGQVTPSSPGTETTGILAKAAFAGTSALQSAVLNAGTVETATSSIPAGANLLRVTVGQRIQGDGNLVFDGTLSRIAIWPTVALPAAALQQVTQ